MSDKTYAQEAGYEIGTHARVIVDDHHKFEKGDIVKLDSDDKSPAPRWERILDGVKGYADISRVAKIGQDSNTNLISRVKKAKDGLDKAQKEYQEALDDLQAELGEGFRVVPCDVAEGYPKNLKLGDRVRCITNARGFITEGRVYTVDSYDPENGELTIEADDDGDPMSYHYTCFERA